MELGNSTCSVANCERTTYRSGFCGSHHHRWKKYGNPLAQRKLPTAIERFESKIRVSPMCWEWEGGTRPDGYGRFWADRHVYAHRFYYEHIHGPVGDKMQIDHICRNRACVNPAHLRAVTPSQNTENQGARGATGERNVYRTPSGYRVMARKSGVLHDAGMFSNFEEAKTAARKLRDRLFTHHVERPAT